MYKNQLQELAQRSCFNLPAYACIREGPDHAPRFKATVMFNGEFFESPNYCNTLRQAEHAAAEVALNILSRRGGSSQSLAARFFDETGVCKNLLQETAQRAGVSLPVYTTTRTGPGHLPVFTCSVEVAGVTSSGEAARTKKQAEKNAAMAAWSALKQFVHQTMMLPLEADQELSEEQEQNNIARALAIMNGREAGTTHAAIMQQHLCSLTQPAAIGSLLLPMRIRSQPPQHLSVQKTSSNSSPGYRSPVGTPRTNSSFPVTLCDVSSLSRELTREALAASRASVGSMHDCVQAVPLHVRNLVACRDRHEMPPPPLREHQLDEDEWLRGDSSRVTLEREDRSDANHKADHGSLMVHGSYNPMSWSDSSHLWGMHLAPLSSRMPAGGTAMPVRLRPAVTVCAAPPPRRPEPREQEDIRQVEAAAAHKLLNQLNL
ncbi:unnamed protein product [Sphagnum troendelagicum]|uniref:DRBM domain-containing protein n=1 Tax=Sphagnum troendelagicum TaxID=128251 RepID=A0ABP0TQ63_9BRYO